MAPESQARVGNVHGVATRASMLGLHVVTGDHALAGNRVPREWAGLTKGQRGRVLWQPSREGTGRGLLWEYGMFVRDVLGCVGGV